MWELDAGYEAPAQFAEETRDAARIVPWAMVTSVVATALCGGLHLAALLFSVQVRPNCCASSGLHPLLTRSSSA